MLIAAFVIFWAVAVLHYAVSGRQPLAWAGLTGPAELRLTATLLGFCLLHMAGTALSSRGSLPAVLRAIALAGMATCFGWLAWAGIGTSAAPTYLGITVACIGAIAPAAKDARYARSIHAARQS